MAFRSFLVLILTAFFLSLNTSAIAQDADEEYECPNRINHRPDKAELQSILEAHKGGIVGWIFFEDDSQIADFCNMDLSRMDLSNSDLQFAFFMDTNLSNTNLEGADLSYVFLNRAFLFETNLTDARLSYVDLEDAQYEPLGAPKIDSVVNLENLTTVWFTQGNHSGLVQLQKALQQAGLRELEREATYALQYGITWHQIVGFHPGNFSRENEINLAVLWNRMVSEPLEFFNGVFRLVFFEWTTEWGLKPGRALLILIGLLSLMTFVYIFPIVAKFDPKKESRIYKVLPPGRLVFSKKGSESAKTEKIDPLTAKGLRAFGWAFYFSLLSATTIGWRELNVGNWISRVQPKEFGLRGRGWVRVVSGAQSLLSVYLLAMWALTYFGRPFQ